MKNEISLCAHCNPCGRTSESVFLDPMNKIMRDQSVSQSVIGMLINKLKDSLKLIVQFEILDICTYFQTAVYRSKYMHSKMIGFYAWPAAELMHPQFKFSESIFHFIESKKGILNSKFSIISNTKKKHRNKIMEKNMM